MALVVEEPFWWIPVLCMEGCSADSCDFGVLLRGGELRAFRLCRLSHRPPQSHVWNVLLCSCLLRSDQQLADITQGDYSLPALFFNGLPKSFIMLVFLLLLLVFARVKSVPYS